MGLFDFFRKSEKKSIMHDMILMTNPNAGKYDIIPTGVGEFGLEKTNPIPVYGIDKVDMYMQQLRYKYVSQKGAVVYYPVQYKRTNEFDQSSIGSSISESDSVESSCSADNIGGNIDVYNVYSFNGARKLCTLFIHSYHLKTSESVPKGFVHAKSVPKNQDGQKLLALMSKQK